MQEVSGILVLGAMANELMGNILPCIAICMPVATSSFQRGSFVGFH